ncbi:hypothetical protein ACFFRR_006647 [Megaselia abdita]
MPSLSSGSGSSASSARIEGPHEWVEAFNGDIPEGAVAGGVDHKNDTIYVARGVFKDILCPGSLCPKDGGVYVCLEGSVGKLTAYEVLCNAKVIWKNWSAGNAKLLNSGLKEEAIVGWVTDEAPMLVGRVKIKEAMAVGMYHGDNQIFYAAYQGKEMAFKKFELLLFDL